MRRIACFLCAAALAFCGEARAAKIVAFGDSWAVNGFAQLQWVLLAHGHLKMTVANYGVGASTADHWANVEPDALSDAVSRNPDAAYVWLSILGNDVAEHYGSGRGGASAADNDRNLRKMLSDLFDAHPGVKVVSFGYDFPNFEFAQNCRDMAAALFPGFDTADINRAALRDIGDVLAGIDPDYPDFTYVPGIWGALQAEAEVPGAPNVLLPSPEQYFPLYGVNGDCIHPTPTGYNIIMNRFYDLYWAGELGAPGCSAAPGAAAGAGAGAPWGTLAVYAAALGGFGLALRRRAG